MNDDKLQSFLKNGIEKYGEVVSTIRFFETQINDKLTSAIAKKDLFDVFKPSVPLNKIRFKPSDYSNDTAKYIWTYIKGKIKGKLANLEAGIAWDWAEMREPIVLYASFSEGDDKIRHFTYKSRSERIKILQQRSRTLIYMVPAKEYALEDDFALLLKKLQTQVA